MLNCKSSQAIPTPLLGGLLIFLGSFAWIFLCAVLMLTLLSLSLSTSWSLLA